MGSCRRPPGIIQPRRRATRPTPGRFTSWHAPPTGVHPGWSTSWTDISPNAQTLEVHQPIAVGDAALEHRAVTAAASVQNHLPAGQRSAGVVIQLDDGNREKPNQVWRTLRLRLRALGLRARALALTFWARSSRCKNRERDQRADSSNALPDSVIDFGFHRHGSIACPGAGSAQSL